MLSVFIRENLEEILTDWEGFAAILRPATVESGATKLRDTGAMILGAVADDMEVPQTLLERIQRSQRVSHPDSPLTQAARSHASGRLADLFTLNQLVAEYRALRANVVRRWRSGASGDGDQVEELMRFDEAIDQSLAEAIAWYDEHSQKSRDLFIGQLGHDLKDPLATVMHSAEVLRQPRVTDDQRIAIAGRLLRSARWMDRLTDDLLGFARLRFGAGIPLVRAEMDLARLCRTVILDLKSDHPDAVIGTSLPDRLIGDWDAARLAQALSNLLINAIRHGDGTGVRLEARAEEGIASIIVQNPGPIITPDRLGAIFHPFASDGHNVGSDEPPRSHGLGLHISKSVVEAHQGTITAVSNETDGTVFTVRLPGARETSASR